jgi:hypothetical protein
MDDNHNPKGWTFASFEAYVESSIRALKEATSIAMSASEKAIDKAEKADDKRFSLLNEFRATTNDQQAHFAGKESTNFRLDSLDAEITALKLSRSNSEGKGQGVWLMAVVIGQALLTIAGLAALFLHSH